MIENTLLVAGALLCMWLGCSRAFKCEGRYRMFRAWVWIYVVGVFGSTLFGFIPIWRFLGLIE
jgi:hypothetical protein